MKIAYPNALCGHSIPPGRAMNTYGKVMSRPPAWWPGAAASHRIDPDHAMMVSRTRTRCSLATSSWAAP